MLCMRPANVGRRYIVTSSLIGWAHTQNDPWKYEIYLYCLIEDVTPVLGPSKKHTGSF